jgi:hypothetical protein
MSVNEISSVFSAFALKKLGIREAHKTLSSLSFLIIGAVETIFLL